jgi:hypothetical protein
MTEKPILFSTPMVQAILNGRKTVTRRVIKGITDLFIPFENPVVELFPVDNQWYCYDSGYPEDGADLLKAPYQICQRLWVRETWGYFTILGGHKRENIVYRADEPDNDSQKWRPPIFMPRKYSRITLEVTGVRVERLQEITEEDAIREGICMGQQFNSPIEPFRLLWDSINSKKYPWASNPWVWVIEFKRVN